MGGLDKSTEGYLGTLLDVTPVHGYGWSENRLQGNDYAHDSILPPPPFAMRLTRLWSFDGDERRGGVGLVESPGHVLDGMWVIFSTRHEGDFDFTARPAMYNLDVSVVEPTESKQGWPIAPEHARSPIAYQGWGKIRAGTST